MASLAVENPKEMELETLRHQLAECLKKVNNLRPVHINEGGVMYRYDPKNGKISIESSRGQSFHNRGVSSGRPAHGPGNVQGGKRKKSRRKRKRRKRRKTKKRRKSRRKRK